VLPTESVTVTVIVNVPVEDMSSEHVEAVPHSAVLPSFQA
jgi:hypothetical protein